MDAGETATKRRREELIAVRFGRATAAAVLLIVCGVFGDWLYDVAV
jgi:hypothetical protein